MLSRVTTEADVAVTSELDDEDEEDEELDEEL
jgi:hypothetical protein